MEACTLQHLVLALAIKPPRAEVVALLSQTRAHPTDFVSCHIATEYDSAELFRSAGVAAKRIDVSRRQYFATDHYLVFDSAISAHAKVEIPDLTFVSFDCFLNSASR